MEKVPGQRHTMSLLAALVAAPRPVVALVPVGSTEPHGPHLGLGTDVVISAAACVRAAEIFEARGPVTAIIAPAVSYGVTECATGFPGAVSVPAEVLTAYLGAICDGLLASKASATSSPGQQPPRGRRTTRRCARAFPAGEGDKRRSASRCPLTRRWAGQDAIGGVQERCVPRRPVRDQSIVMAAAARARRRAGPRRAAGGADLAERRSSPAGVMTFAAMGLDAAYAGNPAGCDGRRGRAADRAAGAHGGRRGSRGAGAAGHALARSAADPEHRAPAAPGA